MERQSLAQGQARVKFKVEWSAGDPPSEEEWRPLAKTLTMSEQLGAAPILPDGLIGGNGAVLSGSSIVVSRSGRTAHTPFTQAHFVRVVRFNCQDWKATYQCPAETAKPSSDTPLLWHALQVAPVLYGWTKRPQFVLHGHSCATEEEAAARGIPCSTNETLFSTPDDLKALMDLLQRYSYPEHQVYVRKNHGFFLLAENEQEACHIFQTRLAPSPLCPPSMQD